MIRLSRKRRVGFTLLEALIVTVMFFLAMGMITVLFLYASRMSRAGDQRSDLQAGRLKAEVRLRRAMGNSYQSGNTVFYWSPGPERADLVLSLISAVDDQGRTVWNEDEQRPIFQGYDVFYRDQDSNTLRYLRYPSAPFEAAVPLSEAALRTYIPSQTSQELATEVMLFQMIAPDDSSVQDQWSNPLGVKIGQETAQGAPLVSEIFYKFASL